MGEYLASDRVVNVMPKEAFGKAVTYIRNQWADSRFVGN
jgi:hypothetical protein